MGYTVHNGTPLPIILNQFEGATYYVGAGESLEVESHRAALTLEDFGATLSREDRGDAINAEEERIGRRDEGGSTTADFEGTQDFNPEPGVPTHIEGVEGADLGQGVVEDDPSHVTEDGDKVGTADDAKQAGADQAAPVEPVADSTVDKTVKATRTSK